MQLPSPFKEAWIDFGRRNQAFVDGSDALDAVFKLALATITARSEADRLIVGLSHLSVEDFHEILVLSMNGYGSGAQKLLRGLYERAVTIRHLHRHPELAERFARFARVQKGRLARAWLETVRDNIEAGDRALLDAAIVEASEVRDDYTIPCRECGHTRQAASWGPDVVSMARGTPLYDLIGSCHYEPMLYSHATSHAVDARMVLVDTDHYEFDDDIGRVQADHALFWAHTVILEVLAVIHERFVPAGLAEALARANAAHETAWERF